jgi:Raf kinase inhibitor-like YbhB/YbcL family protein
VKLLKVSLGLAVALATAFAQPGGQKKGPPPPPFLVTSSEFADGGDLPRSHSCAVGDAATTPPFEWKNVPPGTQSLAFIFHDGDAHPGKGIYDVTHWIAWNIPPSTTSLAAGIKPGDLPDGTRQGKSISGANAYRSACPPPNTKPHHYIFELYALDEKVDLPADASRADLMKAIDGHIIGSTVYTSVFHQ